MVREPDKDKKTGHVKSSSGEAVVTCENWAGDMGRLVSMDEALSSVLNATYPYDQIWGYTPGIPAFQR